MSLPEHCYSDLLLESAELLAVDNGFDKAVHVLGRLLGTDLSVLAVETAVRNHSQCVQAFYVQREAFSRREEGVILVAQADGKGVPMVRPEERSPNAKSKVRLVPRDSPRAGRICYNPLRANAAAR